jgi:hypothetical protein
VKKTKTASSISIFLYPSAARNRAADTLPGNLVRSPSAHPLESPHDRRRYVPLAAGLAAFTVMLPVAWLCYLPPAARNAPATEFSAVRAVALLDRLIGDGRPHWIGTEANAQLRRRILAEFERLGYAPQVQTAQLREYTVNNIVVPIQGTSAERTIMLASHYDSVQAGPGAGDSGAAVAAILEIARILRLRPPRNDVLLLLTNGEEAGLLGARAFVRDNPLARRIDVAVNMDARGSSGPSLMYQTSEGNLPLVRLFARAVRRPVTGSMFNLVYQRMPNNTDFTIFNNAGIAGFNFAFIGSPRNYHTARDTVANLDPRSVQHTGDNAVLLALDAAKGPLRTSDDAVYFDFLTKWTLWWPAPWTVPLIMATAVLWLLALARVLRNRALGLRGLLWGLAAGLTLWTLPVAISLALSAMTGGILRRERWPPHLLPTVLLYWAISAVVLAAVARWLAPRAGRWGLWFGAWFWWLALAALAAAVVPAASYLWLVPVAVAAVTALLVAWALRSDGALAQLVAGLPPALVALCLWMPLELLLSDAIGLAVNPLTTVRASFVLSALLPLVPVAQLRRGRAAPSGPPV